MKKILALITAVMLLVLVVLPGLGDSVVECTDKEGIAYVREVFTSDGITRVNLSLFSSARALFAYKAGFCLICENACGFDSLASALLKDEVYVCLEPTNQLAILNIFMGNEAICFTCDLFGLGICNYVKTSVDSSISSATYLEKSKMSGLISEYWQISFSEFVAAGESL